MKCWSSWKPRNSHDDILPPVAGSPNAPSTTVVVTWLFFLGGKGGGMMPVVGGKHFFVEGKPKTAGIRFLVNQKKNAMENEMDPLENS